MKKKDTIIFILLNGIASALNFAVYPVLSRILSDTEFVEVTVALALFTQLSSFMLSVVALTIGISKYENTHSAKELTEKLQAVLAHLFLFVLFIFILTSPLFLHKIQLSVAMLVPISAMLGLSISMSIINGYLNGAQKLIKLGVAIVFSAVLQLVLCIGVALLSESGVASLNAMAFGSFISIVLIYRFYSKDNLPSPSSIFLHRLSLYKSKKTQALIKYALCAAIATLLMNIIMIIDLLIINNKQIDSGLYSDLYIISRIVFFGGMLFIWPFLSAIDVKKPKNNINSFYKLSAILILILAFSVFAIQIFGNQLVEFILGSNYVTSVDVKLLGTLSVLYKFSFLLITALSLFFIVVRSYWVLWLALILGSATVAFIFTLDSTASSIYIVGGLNIIASFVVAIGLYVFIKLNRPATEDIL